METNSKLTPIVKWAGGKRWLMQGYGEDLFPREVDRYVDPFLGGAAILFERRYTGALLADANPELVNCYHIVRDYPTNLRMELQRLEALHSKSFYYQMRNYIPSNDLERAARFLYLNRTCWNGLYRVNKQGKFNVPIGTKSKIVLRTDNFIELSRLLKQNSIYHWDFRDTLSNVTSRDFVYIDPPYTVKHNINGFLKYNEKIFSWSDQIALRDQVYELERKGTQILISQANHESIKNLYVGIGQHTEIDRHSVLAGRADRRTRVSELIIKVNY